MIARTEVLRFDALRPNPWNYNIQDPFIFDKEKESIKTHGFIDPATVRAAPEIDTTTAAHIADRAGATGQAIKDAAFEIVDGEHRWLAYRETLDDIESGDLQVVEGAELDSNGVWRDPEGQILGRNKIAGSIATELHRGEIPVTNLGEIPDSLAKRLTIQLNETKGTPDVEGLSQLVASIARESGYVGDLPFTDDHLSTLLENVSDEDLESLLEGEFSSEGGENEFADWKTVALTMHPEAYAVYRQAYAHVENRLKEGDTPLNADEEIAHGQVVEALSAEYLAGDALGESQ